MNIINTKSKSKMIFNHLSKKIFLPIILLIFGNTAAQNLDNLNIELQFKDSILKIDALYKIKVKENSDTKYFLLNPGVDSLIIKGNSLNGFEMSSKPNRPLPFWKLNFSRTLKKGETVDLHFTYQIDLTKQNHMKSNWIELNVDKLWFPNHNDLNNKFTYVATVSGLPKDYTLIGNMEAKVNASNPNKIVIKKQIPDMEVLILAGKDMTFWKPNAASSVTFFTSQQTKVSVLTSMHKKVKQSIQLMNTTFGKSSPIKDFRVVLRNTTREEIGFQFNRKNMIITGADFNSYGNLSHEIAHFWWTDANFIEEPWLNESFANYAMFLVQEQYDESDFKTTYKSYSEKSMSAPSVGKATLFSDNSYEAYYIKGAILLKKLEGIIGKTKMLELLELRVNEKINSTLEFLNLLERITDSKTRIVFEEMLQE